MSDATDSFYLSIVPTSLPSASDLVARSQLLKETGVMYTDRQVWVTGDGWMPLLRCRRTLSFVEMQVLELKAASTFQIKNAKEPEE